MKAEPTPAEEQQAPTPAEQTGSRISTDDIHNVQCLIERCLQLYMSQREVVAALQQAKIEPGFTQLVWQKLQEQNPEFFAAYTARLRLRDQVVHFNYLLDQYAASLHTRPPAPDAGASHPLTTAPLTPYAAPQLGHPVGMGPVAMGYAPGMPAAGGMYGGYGPPGYPLPAMGHAVGHGLGNHGLGNHGLGNHGLGNHGLGNQGLSPGMDLLGGMIRSPSLAGLGLESETLAGGMGGGMARNYSLSDLTMELTAHLAADKDSSLALHGHHHGLGHGLGHGLSHGLSHGLGGVPGGSGSGLHLDLAELRSPEDADTGAPGASHGSAGAAAFQLPRNFSLSDMDLTFRDG